MSRYIDAEKCPELLDEEYKKTRKLIEEGEEHLDNLAEGFMEAHCVILRMPTADVEKVRHGEWEFNQLDNFRKYSVTCPFCSAEYVDNYDGYINVDDFNYCPNCGAKMDGGTK